jgi:hypothetical protein
MNTVNAFLNKLIIAETIHAKKHLILPNRFSEHCVHRTHELIDELKFNEAHRRTAILWVLLPCCDCCPLL